MLHDSGHDMDHSDHPAVHVVALFDGAIQFACEARADLEDGHLEDAARRLSWVHAVLEDLAQRIGWGTGTLGRQVAAILTYLDARLDTDAISPQGLAEFIGDLETVFGLWSVVCGRRVVRRAAA